MARVKVCSYPRSGTHLLMAYLYHNFDVGPNLARLVTVRGQKWSGTGTEQAVVPWAGLFGSHHELQTIRKFQRDQIIYIVRNPIDCLYSNWKFFGGEQTIFSQWLSTIQVLQWQEHVSEYIKHCFWLRYEDLRDDSVKCLERIQRHFKLQRRKLDDWIKIHVPVGWTPKRITGHYTLDSDDREIVLEALKPQLMEDLGYA